jgi:hypothetical protein
VVIGAGRLLADTSVAELSARSVSLEDAFLELTSGSAQYRSAPDTHGPGDSWSQRGPAGGPAPGDPPTRHAPAGHPEPPAGRTS